MKKILHLIIFGLQGIATFFTLLTIYMIFVLLDYQGGIDSFVGTLLFQPIIGAVLSVITIGMCVVVGLPIRLSNVIRAWWEEKFWIPIAGTFIGFSLLIISILPSMTEVVHTTIDHESIEKEIPNVWAAATGWFLISFSLLHTFPPRRIRLWVEQQIDRYTPPGNKNVRQHN